MSSDFSTGYQEMRWRRRKLGRSTLQKSFQQPVKENEKMDVMPSSDRLAVNVLKIHKKQAVT
jgi:hypothetical protein